MACMISHHENRYKYYGKADTNAKKIPNKKEKGVSLLCGTTTNKAHSIVRDLLILSIIRSRKKKQRTVSQIKSYQRLPWRKFYSLHIWIPFNFIIRTNTNSRQISEVCTLKSQVDNSAQRRTHSISTTTGQTNNLYTFRLGIWQTRWHHSTAEDDDHREHFPVPLQYSRIKIWKQLNHCLM